MCNKNWIGRNLKLGQAPILLRKRLKLEVLKIQKISPKTKPKIPQNPKKEFEKWNPSFVLKSRTIQHRQAPTKGLGRFSPWKWRGGIVSDNHLDILVI